MMLSALPDDQPGRLTIPCTMPVMSRSSGVVSAKFKVTWAVVLVRVDTGPGTGAFGS